MSMNVIELIKKRRTIRNYDPNFEIPKEQLDEIINSARISPTARDLQDIDFIVLRNKDKLKEIEKTIIDSMPKEKSSSFLERKKTYGVDNVVTCDAPVIILLVRNERKSDKFCEVDAGIACMSMILTAQHFNIESMCLGVLARFPKIEEILGLKKDSLVLGLALGKIKGEPIVHEKNLINKVTYID